MAIKKELKFKPEPQTASKQKTNSQKQNISVSLNLFRLKMLNELTEKTPDMTRSDHIESALDIYFNRIGHK
jgi:hypothetical protein